MKPGIAELGFLIVFYIASIYKLRGKSSPKAVFIFTAGGIALASAGFMVRSVSYVTAFLTIIAGFALSEKPGKLISGFIASLAIINVLATILFPAFMMPGYDEKLQLEILKEIKSNERVLSQWDLSPYVIYYTGATTVTGGDVYYLWMHSTELYKGYEDFFFGKNTDSTFNATVLYFDRTRFKDLYQKIGDEGKFKRIKENERFAAFRL